MLLQEKGLQEKVLFNRGTILIILCIVHDNPQLIGDLRGKLPFSVKWRGRDLNPRHKAYESPVLT
jgi:hypothetical protein